MNRQQKARTRAHAHGVIAADMAADGHANWARFHEAKMRQIQAASPGAFETRAESQARQQAEFLNGEYENAC